MSGMEVLIEDLRLLKDLRLVGKVKWNILMKSLMKG